MAVRKRRYYCWAVRVIRIIYSILGKDEMDGTDLKILAILQEDCSVSVGEIANRVGLSQTPCWRRIQRLEESGVIRRRVALLDPQAIGLGLTVFVEIETGDHSKAWLDRFAQVVLAMPEVMEVHRMAGDVDYLLRVAVANMGAYDDLTPPIPTCRSRTSPRDSRWSWSRAPPPSRSPPTPLPGGVEHNPSEGRLTALLQCGMSW